MRVERVQKTVSVIEWRQLGIRSQLRTLYTSYVKTLETAINSALVALVTARNSNTSMIAAPDLPSRAAAAEGAGNPAETSAALKVGIAGSPFKATAASPRVVANVNGIANHANPPSRYALTQLAGRLAMA